MLGMWSSSDTDPTLLGKWRCFDT